MKILPGLSLLSGAVLCGLLVSPVLAADDSAAISAQSGHDASAPGFHFEIVNGVIADHMVNGKPMAATLKNVVGLARDLFPDVMIAQVSADNVTIGDVLMESRKPPQAGAFFHALILASQGRFDCFTAGDGSLLLTAPRTSEPTSGPRVVQVFNLTKFLEPRAAELNEHLKDLEGRKKVMGSQLLGPHPDFDPISNEIEVTKAQLAEEKHSPDDLRRILDRLRGTVTEVLAAVNPKATPPEISFNQDTNLLIVVGSSEAVDVASKVIGALN